MAYCGNCGQKLAPENKFCPACGTPVPKLSQDDASPAEEVFAVRPEKAAVPSPASSYVRRKILKADFFKKAVLLLLAILLLLTSFLPVVTVRYEGSVSVGDLKDVACGVSPIYVAAAFFDSLMSYDLEEIEDSDLMRDMAKYADIASEEMKDGKLSGRGQQYLAKTLLTASRLGYRYEKQGPTTALVCSFAAAILCVVLGILLFVFALLNFIFYMTDRASALEKRAIALLSVFPGLLGLVNFLFPKVLGADLLTIHLSSAGPSGLTIASWICMGLAFAAGIVLTALSAKKRKSVRWVRRSITAGLALITLCLVCVPVMFVGAKTAFKGKSTEREVYMPVQADAFNSFVFSENTLTSLEKYREMSKQDFSNTFLSSLKARYSGCSIYEAEEGKATSVNMGMLSMLMGWGGSYRFGTAFSFLIVFYSAVILALSFLLGASLRSLCGEEVDAVGVLTARILLLVFALLALLLTITYVVVIVATLRSLGSVPEETFSLSMGAGTILVTVFSLLLLCVPFGKNKVVADDVVTDVPTEDGSEEVPA